MERFVQIKKNVWQKLHDALEKGKFDEAISSIEKRFTKGECLAILEYKEPKTWNTLLKLACNQSNYEAVECIIEKTEVLGGKNSVNKIVNQYVNNRDYPIHRAARLGDLELTKLLIANGALIDPENTTGRTPLFVAVTHYHLKVVELLLAHSADPNIQNYEGQTSLHQAVHLQDTELTKTLLEKGAFTYVPNKARQTPFCIAVARYNLEIMTLLIIYSIGFNMLNEEAKRAYSIIKTHNPILLSLDTLDFFLFLAVMSGCFERAQHFIEGGAKINAQNDAGQTALHVAVLEKQKQITILEKHKAAETEQGMLTKMQQEAILRQQERVKTQQKIIELLIEQPKVDINIRDVNGKVPLLFAIYYNDPIIVQHLLAKGSSIDMLHAALQVAASTGAQASILGDLIDHIPIVEFGETLQKNSDSTSNHPSPQLHY